MSRYPLRYRLILSAASFLLSVASLEAGLRIWIVDSIHLSVEGDDLMARVVARTLRERGIVP